MSRLFQNPRSKTKRGLRLRANVVDVYLLFFFYFAQAVCLGGMFKRYAFSFRYLVYLFFKAVDVNVLTVSVCI